MAEGTFVLTKSVWPVDLLERWADYFDGKKLEELVANVEGRVEYQVPKL